MILSKDCLQNTFLDFKCVDNSPNGDVPGTYALGQSYVPKHEFHSDTFHHNLSYSHTAIHFIDKLFHRMFACQKFNHFFIPHITQGF